ncbi:uncharacterized protein [Pocillopora verrucosa]|uniref:uncharacterized protein n=1 Tax=Pocillopora verrucosa TaxID=203993 RepID=UPI00334038AC
MSVKIIVLFAVIYVVNCRVPSNPLKRMFAGVDKRAPSCAYDCVPICYDDGYGSYNRRSGSCSKSGYSCCEWVVHGKREIKEEKRAPSCAYDCVPICYDDGYGSYNRRSGSCSKSGYSCCEWVVHGKRDATLE